MRKRLEIWILVVVFSISSGYFAANAGPGVRRILGIEKAMLDVGECNQDGQCVIDEKRLYPRGYLFQYVDKNADGHCDHVIEWKPIEDPYYGRFWELVRHRDCDVNTEKYSATFINPAANLTMGLAKFTQFDDAGEPIDFEVLNIRWSGGGNKILSLEPGTYIVTEADIEERKIEDWKVFMVPHDKVIEL